MSDCVPAKLKRIDRYASPGVGLQRCKEILGDKPDDGKKYVVRHLCHNDSMAPNGFVCCNSEHIVWGTYSENTMDRPKEVRSKKRRFLKPRNRRKGIVKYSDETKEKCRQAAIRGWETRKAGKQTPPDLSSTD